MRHYGAVYKGRKQVYRLTLMGGRSLHASADHLMRTKTGWVELGELRAGDAVAVLPFVGLPYEPGGLVLRPRIESESRRRALVALGLDGVSLDDPRFPVILRLLGYTAGDGHVSKNGKRVSIFTSEAEDAAGIVRDFAALGFRASIYSRQREPKGKVSHTIYVDSVVLNEVFAGLGCPRGKKEWPRVPFPWLLDVPSWAVAHFVSGFASAEGTCPRVLPDGTIPNLVLTQSGQTSNALDFIADLLLRLGFETSVYPHDRPRNKRQRQKFMLQILGGADEQVRFLEQVGYVRCAYKRRAAAVVCGTVWNRRAYLANRIGAQQEARALHAAGRNWKEVVEEVSERWEVSRAFVYHAIYSGRGTPRRLPGDQVLADTGGEIVWARISAIVPEGVEDVYDVVTSDEAQAFFANGVVVHNCGNAAIRTDLTLSELGADEPEVGRRLNAIADEIASTVSFGVGRKNLAGDAPLDHPLFEDPAWDALPPRERGNLREKARAQLGTVGSGNHYVDVFAGEAGRLWVGVHFGSRGFGHTVASGFLALGQGARWGERVPEREVLLPLAAPLGHDYFALMNLAGRYAYAGREWVARKVVSILGGREVELVHNHHNFAWRETIDGDDFIVVRKGATPAFPGQKGFIGGSMGDDAVIVRGTVDADAQTARLQREALFSTVHGAGRVMSRTEAAGKRKGWGAKARIVRPGKITPEMMQAWIADKGVILRGGGLDESPHVYRRLPEVLAAQGSTIEVLHTLRPLIVVMAGADEFDPYKD